MCTRDPKTGLPPKTVETRHWTLNVGPDEQFPLAIHAAQKKWKRDGHDPAMLQRVRDLKLDHMEMVYGAILCVVWVTGWRKVDDLIGRASADDLLFGNYDNTCPHCGGEGCEKCNGTGKIQRYGWVTDPTKLKVLKAPHYCRGMQQVFTWQEPEGTEYK